MTRIEADFCIAGGGMAGVCAAVAAAREGCRVVLVQDRSVMGGNASSEIRMHIVGASCSGRRPGARESGIIEEIRLEEAVRNPLRSPHLFDLILYDLVRSEPNITLLLDTHCCGCTVSEANGSRRIRALHASRPLTEDRFEIIAAFYADCTGDSRLGLEAGAHFRMGREASDEFGEPHAPPLSDLKTLGSTILFMARDTGGPVPFSPPSWARRFTDDQLRLRSHREFEYGYWWAEWGGELDTIKDNDAIRHELLAIALGVWDHVKNGCQVDVPDPSAGYEKWLDGALPPSKDAANWALEWVGMLPGKRESRRLLGPCILTESDILSGRLWEDQVAYGGWWIDLHPPAGVDAVHEYPCTQVEVPWIYGIPLRALYSRNVGNLFMAGRNISATHVAFASTRVMGTCSVMGQAIGVAAAEAIRAGVAEAGRLMESGHISAIQQSLLRADAFLPGIAGCDSDDLARAAAVRASSAAAGRPPDAVLTGITRAVTEKLHPSLRAANNVWVSTELPAWVELTWPREVEIGEIHLTFDSGAERELALSMSDAFTNRMVRGPQPEIVERYTLDAGGWSETVEGNYQRKRIHRLPAPVRVRSLRLTVHATHGVPVARVFEIRAYPEGKTGGNWK